jgi:hypothetical protein
MIYITKNGFRKTKWDSDVRQYVDVPIRSILHELRGDCEIEEGVTLGDVFTAVSQSEALCLIIGEWSWCNCEAFHKEVKKPAVPSDLKCIEISRYVEIEPDGTLQVNLDVCGRDGTEATWALDFTPVNELRDLPVKLSPKVLLIDFRGDGFSREEFKNDCFSLLEVLGEIYYEVSFHGSPEDRNEKMGDLFDAVKSIEDGTAKLVPFDPKETIN